MRDYPSNSYKSREEKVKGTLDKEKCIKKISAGNVKTKKNEKRKLASMFILEDIATVKSYIIDDILIPAIKKTISEIINNGTDMFLYGGKKSGDKVSYRNFYNNKKDDRNSNDYSIKNRFMYDDLVFKSRSECDAVREQMTDIIDTYGFVTVADMYDMVDLPAPYTSSKYGWTNIRSAEIVLTRDGYILKLPKAILID